MAEGHRGHDPPILTLLDLADEHRGAITYDWRTRFGVPWAAVPTEMDWGEAWLLLQQVVLDPSSRLAAAVAGWEYPLSREGQIAIDHYDLAHKIAAGKKSITPYPRPWHRQRKRFGRATRPQAEIMAALRARGHGRLLHRQDAAGRWRDELGRFVRP